MWTASWRQCCPIVATAACDVAYEDLDGAEVTFARSAAESARFGLNIARLTLGLNVPDMAAASLAAKALIAQSQADIVVVRYASSATRVAADILLPDRDLLAAGSLTYWEFRLGGDPPIEAPRGKTLTVHHAGGRRQGSVMREVVTSIVTDSFTGYGNHYSANPLLGTHAALDGYVEWASQSLKRPAQDVLVLYDGKEPVGLATLQSDSSGRDVEILLAGLVSAAQGKGWYAHLLAAVRREASSRGARRVVISTQGHNVKVQRAWAREGFFPFDSIDTLHSVRAGLLGEVPVRRRP